MYRLKVIAGPNPGKSYPLAAGEYSIGRQKNCNIILTEENVSKHHCLVLVKNEEIVLKDQGSINGTFVNGVLAKEKKLKLGDRISVGGVVLELKRTRAENVVAASMGKVVALPLNMNRGNQANQALMNRAAAAYPAVSAPPPVPVITAPPVPTDISGKSAWYFENYVMPFFYNFNLKNDWKIVSSVIFGGFLFLNLLISVYPLVDQNREMVMKEASHRARFIARQLAERNAQALSQGAESRVDLGSVDREDGVTAYLVDLDNRIIAPTSRLNQYLVSGVEAAYSVRVAKKYKDRDGFENGVIGTVSETVVVAVEPIKVFDPKVGKNIIIAMSVVGVDASDSIPTGGGLSLIFSESFILTVLLGGLTLYILFRLTLKPFEILNEDVDRVLRGEGQQITQEFKNEEMNSLWDIIRSALQRIPKSNVGGTGDESAAPAGMNLSELEPALRMVSEFGDRGIILCDADRRVIYLNEFFEEISGIRASDSVGQEFISLARDEALSALLKDLFERSLMGGGVSEDVELAGTSYKISASALGISQTQGFLFFVSKGVS